MKAKLRQYFFCEKLVDEELEESNLVRESSEDSFFTYSPFLDTEKNFSEKNNKIIKFQKCIRYINKLDLTNPLAINFQENCSIQNYQVENQSKYIKSILILLCKIYSLSYQNFIIRTHKEASNIIEDIGIKRIFLSNDNEFKAVLPLRGSHFYFKVFYDSFNQEIAVVNFVFVNLVNEQSQLDSIIYLERLGFISEGKRYIYEQQKYETLYSPIKVLKDFQIHRIINDTITILSLFNQNIIIANKGAGSELKRKIKGLAKFIFFECPNFNYIEYYQELMSKSCINVNHLQILIDQLNIQVAWISKLEKELRSGKYDNFEDEILYDRFGIPKEFFFKKDNNYLCERKMSFRYHFRDI
ncbi:hypothetical protein [Listeria innocua]|uniref:hypothetical protein n=1 Tax=Listeria innocua TaxID=1642 RepID=UPI0016292B61|nr:hypothetical protein [Listeria innocua]MBC1925134.1 hypothetical protein [Listeria innocua]